MAGAATAGNNSGCGAGAVGAVVGELAADYALKNGANREDATTFAKVIAAASGVLVGGGGDNAAAVNIASATGANAAANNRGLHQTEAEKLAALKQGKTKAQQERLDAAACALVHCADGVPNTDPNKAKLVAMQTAGAGYTAEQGMLKATGEFVYTMLDPVRDGITRNGQITQRVGGAVNLLSGSVGTVAGAVTTAAATVACPETGLSCVVVPVAAALTAGAYNQAVDGSKAMLGSYTSTEGQRVLDSLNPSTYPGDRDPLVNGLVEAGKLGVTAVLAKAIPKGLAAAEGLEVAPAAKVATGGKGSTGAASEAATPVTPVNPGQDFAMVNGVKVTPLKYGQVYHGTDNATLGLPSNMSAEQVAQKLYTEGLPARGNNVDLIQHAIDNAPDRAFRGTTTQPLSQNKDSGAVLWAGDGGLVIQFKDVKGYDVNQALDGRVPTMGGFGGNPKYGEQEIAVPGAISPSQIDRVGVVRILDNGTIKIEWIDKK